MKKHVSITLIIWVALMISEYETLSKMTSENPMIPYIIGTLYQSILFSLSFYLGYYLFKITEEIFFKR